MAQKRSVEVRVGIFVAVCLAMLAVLIWKFGKYEPLTRHTYDINVVFSNVGGIVEDASVLYAGIKVGSVSAITLDQTGVLKVIVKLAVYDGVKIRKDAKFVINQSGLLGDRYIDIVPQSATAGFLKPGDSVEGSSSLDLSEAIHSVVDVLHQAAGTIERVDKAIQRVDETVLSRPTLDHIDSALANIDTVSSNAIGLSVSLRGVVDDSRGKVDATLTKFSDTADNLKQASSNIDQVVRSNQDEVHAAVKNLAESTARLNNILARLEKGEGTAGKLLTDPTLHDEIVRLVQNWRKYGLLYKEGNRPEPKKPEESRDWKAPQPAHPVQGGGGTLIFGTDSTAPGK
ncbi:MAG TPA: MlaD family protein [Verrucomicrobiae bacterium]|nr:MlaD family protein [Verrucomicrobiae bacterium]